MPNLQQTKTHDVRKFFWRCLLIWKWAKNRAWIRLIWWYDPTNTLILIPLIHLIYFARQYQDACGNAAATSRIRPATGQRSDSDDLAPDFGTASSNVSLPRATWWKYPTRLHESEDVQCEAPKIAKLVYNSNNYGLWYVYRITIVTGRI